MSKARGAKLAYELHSRFQALLHMALASIRFHCVYCDMYLSGFARTRVCARPVQTDTPAMSAALKSATLKDRMQESCTCCTGHSERASAASEKFREESGSWDTVLALALALVNTGL